MKNQSQTIRTIRALRAKNGYSLDDIAAETGITRSKCYKIESHNELKNERYNDLMALSQAFNMTVDELIKENLEDIERNQQ